MWRMHVWIVDNWMRHATELNAGLRCGVWCDSFNFVTWPMHVCAIMHSCKWYNSCVCRDFACSYTPCDVSKCVKRPIYVGARETSHAILDAFRDSPYSYSWRDVTHARDITYSCVCHNSFICEQEYAGNKYRMLSEEKLQRFMLTPWTFVGLHLPVKLPLEVKAIDLSALPLVGYLEQTVVDELTLGLLSLGRAAPRFPGIRICVCVCKYYVHIYVYVYVYTICKEASRGCIHNLLYWQQKWIQYTPPCATAKQHTTFPGICTLKSHVFLMSGYWYRLDGQGKRP